MPGRGGAGMGGPGGMGRGPGMGGPMGRPGGFWGMFPFFGGFRPGCMGCLPMVVASLGVVLTVAFMAVGL